MTSRPVAPAHDAAPGGRTARALVSPTCGIFAALAIALACAGNVAAQSARGDPPPSQVPPAGDATPPPSFPLARDFSSDIEARKNYVAPALEILGFDMLVNLVNRRYSGSSDYDSNLSTMAFPTSPAIDTRAPSTISASRRRPPAPTPSKMC